jgi:hypothetical protein
MPPFETVTKSVLPELSYVKVPSKLPGVAENHLGADVSAFLPPIVHESVVRSAPSLLAASFLVVPWSPRPCLFSSPSSK